MSDRLLPQLKLGPRVGGVKELATRVTFYNGVANTLMLAGVYYSNNPAIPGTAMRIQGVLPTIGAFYGALVVAGIAAMAFEHTVMIRAQAEYNQLQQFDEDVSPIRRDVSEVQRELQALREDLDKGDEK